MDCVDGNGAGGRRQISRAWSGVKPCSVIALVDDVHILVLDAGCWVLDAVVVNKLPAVQKSIGPFVLFYAFEVHSALFAHSTAPTNPRTQFAIN